nr:MAG TPA: hypothetical protein [Siphoviridae sp. ctweK11]DAK46667.1 MAG TPA: hypothetical protein [Caudoviricetes sp.]DAW32811.1 MAG TPA: hypothetical protein [Caudoviricetes sp.]
MKGSYSRNTIQQKHSSLFEQPLFTVFLFFIL